MADTFRIRRKSNGDVIGPITAEQAKTIAGYPGDFEKLEEPKASRAGYDDAPAPRRAPR